nr:MAG TPA: hypothetical protein [Caudoviricetes sp.]
MARLRRTTWKPIPECLRLTRMVSIMKERRRRISR